MKTLAHNISTHEITLIDSDPPEPSESECLVRVHATALTNGELDWSKSGFWDNVSYAVPGFDVSGTVITSVRGSPFKPGDEVYGRVSATRLGCAREFATMLPSEMALRPTSLSIEKATTVPMSAETAWQALFFQAALKEPDVDAKDAGAATSNGSPRILVLNASGGCGLFAVQFAKLIGAYVVATCGPSNLEFIKQLGADEVINYRQTSLSDWGQAKGCAKFDVVLDCAGASARAGVVSVLKPGSVLISIVPDFDDPPLGMPEGSRAWFFIMKSDGEQLAKISRLFERGQCSTVVNSVWALEHFEQAFACLGKGLGKVVLKVGDYHVMEELSG